MSVHDLSLQAGVAGLVLGLSFILSLGPQNLRLIRAGVMNSHPFTVATVGYLSEIVVVLVGMELVDRTFNAFPAATGLLQGLGIAFLVWCSVQAFKRRARYGGVMLEAGTLETRRTAVLSMLTVTWLNPLVYLEVMLLAGILASSYGAAGQVWFSVGYLAAAAVKMYGWSTLGRLASRWLATPHRQMQFETASGGLLMLAAALLTLQLANAVMH